MEFFDLLDCSGRKTGETISRDEAHRTGAWHGAFHCLIIRKRKQRGYALFQLRSKSKKIAPDKFDVSVGGHYAAGEGVETAGPRELKEELGIDVRFDDLLPIGRRVSVYCFAAGVMEYEFQDVFFLPHEMNPENMTLQPGEVDAVLEMDIELGIKLFSGEIQAAAGRLYKNAKAPKDAEISTTDFVPCLDNYYLKLLLLARRYFNGERESLII